MKAVAALPPRQSQGQDGNSNHPPSPNMNEPLTTDTGSVSLPLSGERDRRRRCGPGQPSAAAPQGRSRRAKRTRWCPQQLGRMVCYYRLVDRKPSHLQIMEDLAGNDELMAAKIQLGRMVCYYRLVDRKPSHLQIMEDLAGNDELMAAKIQLGRMVCYYRLVDRKPSHLQIMEDLAGNDQLMAAKIQIWFQNRRANEKKKMKALTQSDKPHSTVAASPSSPLPAPPPSTTTALSLIPQPPTTTYTGETSLTKVGQSGDVHMTMDGTPTLNERLRAGARVETAVSNTHIEAAQQHLRPRGSHEHGNTATRQQCQRDCKLCSSQSSHQPSVLDHTMRCHTPGIRPTGIRHYTSMSSSSSGSGSYADATSVAQNLSGSRVGGSAFMPYHQYLPALSHQPSPAQTQPIPHYYPPSTVTRLDQAESLGEEGRYSVLELCRDRSASRYSTPTNRDICGSFVSVNESLPWNFQTGNGLLPRSCLSENGFFGSCLPGGEIFAEPGFSDSLDLPGSFLLEGSKLGSDRIPLGSYLSGSGSVPGLFHLGKRDVPSPWRGSLPGSCPSQNFSLSRVSVPEIGSLPMLFTPTETTQQDSFFSESERLSEAFTTGAGNTLRVPLPGEENLSSSFMLGCRNLSRSCPPGNGCAPGSSLPHCRSLPGFYSLQDRSSQSRPHHTSTTPAVMPVFESFARPFTPVCLPGRYQTTDARHHISISKQTDMTVKKTSPSSLHDQTSPVDLSRAQDSVGAKL